jgi:hypothetical protein
MSVQRIDPVLVEKAAKAIHDQYEAELSQIRLIGTIGRTR